MEYIQIDYIPRMSSINKKYKPCEKCGQEMEYVSDAKRFCFDCKEKRIAKYIKKNKGRYYRTGSYVIHKKIKDKGI